MPRTLILDKQQISQRITRLAYQLYEDNPDETEIIIAGILKSGYIVAERIKTILEKISPLKVQLIQLSLHKHNNSHEEVKIELTKGQLMGKVVVVVDDVLNSGETLMHALSPFLNSDVKKLRTVVLMDRNHKRYPVSADFVGFPLATTLQEHVSVVLEKDEEAVYLS